MKLLFLTQVLDRRDAVLGFVSRWVRGLAANTEAVRVIALEVGDTDDLPANVDWREVGRRGRVGRYRRYKSCLKEALWRDSFDTVLAHMVPRYALLAHAPARRSGARCFLWYTHAGIDRRLRLAVQKVEKVFTASPESMRVETPRKVVTGHGIDLEHFASETVPENDGPARLLSVGRLTPKKDPLTVVRALAILRERGLDVELDLVGAGLTGSDEEYQARVIGAIEEAALTDRVRLHGSVPYVEVPERYRRATVVVNASSTGSLDKVCLEAMASRRPVLSCNDGAGELFAELGESGTALCFEPGDPAALADRAEALLRLPAGAREELVEKLHAIVARDHRVDVLMRRLVEEMGGRP